MTSVFKLAPLNDAGQQAFQADRRALQAAGVESRFVQGKQAFDLLLQGANIVLQDVDHLALPLAERPGYLLAQQRDTFLQGRERRFQFMRDMAQGPLAVSLQFGQALAQPVQALAQLAQIGRPADRDRLVETAGAEANNGLFQMPHRAHQPPAHGQGDEQRAKQSQCDPPTELEAGRLELLQSLAILFLDPALASLLE